MFINPIGENHPSEKGEIIQKVVEYGVTKSVFIDHEPGQHNLFGVVLIDHDECISARIAMSKEDAEWLISDNITDPCQYYFITLDQIKKLDPNCGAALEQQFT